MGAAEDLVVRTDAGVVEGIGGVAAVALEGVEAVSARLADKRTQPLRIDPYPWHFEIRPATIANAIRFALRNGWTPTVSGPDFHIAFHEGEFIVLPPGIKFVHQLRSA